LQNRPSGRMISILQQYCCGKSLGGKDRVRALR
jgi:hypothetical protein